MKVILDANVLVAAFAARGLCNDLFEVCLSEHEIVTCKGLLGEVRAALIRKLKLPTRIAESVISFLAAHSVDVEPSPVEPGSCRDVSDLKVLGLADASQCDCLVTGDQDLLILKEFAGIPILSPRDFWKLLQEGGKGRKK